MNPNLSERLVIVASGQDRKNLEQIAHQEGDISLSATIRRLIRAEAARREIKDAEPNAESLLETETPR